jgi:hypothetical protein
MPVFFLLLFGMIEFGFIFKDSLTLASMTRSGARIGAASGNSLGTSSPNTDYQILSAMLGSSTALDSTINYVIIYKASSTSGDLPAGCAPTAPATPPATGVTGECNVYDSTALNAIKGYTTWGQAQGSGYFGCAGASLDQFWCPGAANGQTGRIVSQSGNGGAGPDYLGVYISATHASITKLFVPSITLHDAAVMRIEPQTP